MKKKKRKLRKMAGPYIKNINARVTVEEKARFLNALATGAGPAGDQSKVARWLLLDIYCAYTEEVGDKPHSFADLAKWHLDKKK